MLTSLQKLLVILLQAGNNNGEEWLTVSEQIQLATVEAAVRLKQTCEPVVSIFGLSTLELLDDELATHKFAERFYDANWNTGIKLFRDGVLQLGFHIIQRTGFATVNLSPTQKPRKFRHSVTQYGPTDLLWYLRGCIKNYQIGL